MLEPSPVIEAWIARETRGLGLALRREEDPPIPGEPFMSMEDAKQIIRKALDVRPSDLLQDVAQQAQDEVAYETWRSRVDAAKVALRERLGRPWWVRIFPFRIHLERL